MSGVELRAGFSSDLIRLHLARLAIANAEGYVRAREDIGEFMVGEVQENISGQTLFDGSAMPQSKAAIAKAGKTLQDKGHLRDSYTFNLTQGGVEIGSNLIYAAIHHFGGQTAPHVIRAKNKKALAFGGVIVKSVNHPGSKFPPRPVLGVGPAQERRIGNILIAEIEALQ
jgi:phage gpG-like protein